MIDPALLEHLLRGGHVSMDERISRGAWPNPPLLLSDLVNCIALLIQRDGHFPRPWIPAQPGEPVHEGGVITFDVQRGYLYRAQRSDPINPRVMADSVETVFSTADAAARHYLKVDLLSSGNLDGWKVV